MNDDTNPIVPPVVPPPVVPEHRASWAWAVLSVFFLLLIGLPLLPAKKQVKGSTIDAAQLTTELKTTVIQRDIWKVLKTKPPAEPASDHTKALLNILKEVEPEKGKDALAAKFALTVGRELNRPADADALAYLQNSAKKTDRTYAEIYSGGTLSTEWLSSHRSELPNNFLGRLAAVHAKQGQPDATALTRTDLALTVLLFFGGLVVLLAGLVVLAVLAGGVLGKTIKPVGHPLAGLTKADADRLALRVCLFFLAFVFVPPTVAYALSGKFVAGLATFIGELAFLGVFWWMNRIPIFGETDGFRKLIGSTKQPARLVLFGLAAFAANLPISLGLALFFQWLLKDAPKPTHPLSDQMGMGVNPFTLLIIYALASIMAPIIEELSFRGMLFPALSRFMKPAFAMLLSGFLFGAIHPQGPLLWASLGSIGAVSAFLTYFTGSLIPSMVMHAVHNSAILTMTVVLLM